MQINDTWEIEDAVSGLRLKIIPGTKQDRLHVESLTGGTAADDHPKMNRDFWFTKDGQFDGTGSVVEGMPNPTGQGRSDCGAYPGPGCSVSESKGNA